MRIANVAGRCVYVEGTGASARAIDIAEASGDRFGPEPRAVLEQWAEFRAWVAGGGLAGFAGMAFDPAGVDAPLPDPRQVFAIGLNYDAHAHESGFLRPAAPVVFTKYASSLTGPVSSVALVSETVDWEVELVVVIGQQARNVDAAQAWSYVAALTVGQDLSERTSQHAGPAPQFSLAKSFPGFSPTGPVLVTPDEFVDPDDLALGCELDGEELQSCRTSQMIFPVAALVAHLSSIVTLYPGDLIFTGTPAGVGIGRTPPRYLQAGEVLTSWVQDIGTLRQEFVPSRTVRETELASEAH